MLMENEDGNLVNLTHVCRELDQRHLSPLYCENILITERSSKEQNRTLLPDPTASLRPENINTTWMP